MRVERSAKLASSMRSSWRSATRGIFLTVRGWRARREELRVSQAGGNDLSGTAAIAFVRNLKEVAVASVL